MSNSEENLPSNDTNPGGESDVNQGSAAGQSGNSNGESEHTNSGQSGNQPLDPQHNTGHEHMRIDEEGAEIGPDDEV